MAGSVSNFIQKELFTLERSPFLTTLNELKQTILFMLDHLSGRFNNLPSQYRHLTASEIKSLEVSNNYCDNWNNFIVYQSKKNSINKDELKFTRLIHGNHFDGLIIVDESYLRHNSNIESNDNTCLITTNKCGIFNSYLRNVFVSKASLILNCGCVSKVFVDECVVLRGCDEISCSSTTSFGNGQNLKLGPEVGGRDTKIFAEMLFETATVVAKNRDKLELVQRYEEAVQTYKQCSEFPLSVIRQGTRILNTHKVTDSYIGDYALIDAVTSIHNSTLLSSLEDSVHVTSGAYVDSSIIQWGCSVETMAVVSTSLLCEHSYAKSHAKVSHSVVAPNSGVSGGECTSSLLGPFVGFHHQALLIAALWPEGKGNVGYGANVGSNHTSKAPDQEIWPGEGVFYGLGCSIKYPTNMSEAPYSVIASGVCTLPQRVAMPFSLINSPSTFLSDVSPALNEIIPGWVLKENIYAVLRNERKFQERNKARRNIFDTTIFRPIIAGMLEKARAALMQPRGNKNFPVFLEGDIAGIGKNYLTEINRKQGIEVYTFYLRFYALQGLYFRIKKLGFPKATSLEEDLADPVWMHQRSVIIKEFPEVEMASPFQLLHHYKDMLKKIGESALISKQRDDQRGMKIFPDYKVVHVLAEKDSFVNDTLERIRLTVSEIREWESLSAKNE